MRIDLAENISIQLEELSKKNFRTPKLQLEFILSRIFADGYFSASGEPKQLQLTTDTSISGPRTSFSDAAFGVGLSGGPERKIEAIDFEAIAKQTLNSKADELDNVEFSAARKAFEIANSAAGNALPRLTPEQEQEIALAHQERVAKRNKKPTEQ
jgi:hypothetical protein